MKKNYHKTLIACYLGFITQAISANFAPLLFLTFHRTYHISLGKIAFISTIFFFTQLLVDLFCARYVDKIGYRRCVVASEILSACGLIGLAFLPNILPNAYAGILLSAMIYAAGSGLIEVLVSPIVEACPFDNKDSVMSLLHSFYCWGSVGVILLSTAFLAVFGMERWPILACIWAVLPLYNTDRKRRRTYHSSAVPSSHFLDFPCSYGLRRSKRDFDGAMGFRLCRVCIRSLKKHWRHCRTVPVCCDDGHQQNLLW